MIFHAIDIISAIELAEKKHRKQQRRYTDEPYICHLLNVASSVSGAVFDKSIERYREKMIVAAILHDIIEDTDTDSKEIHSQFGKRIGKYVDDLTDPTPSVGNRAKRKQITRERLRAASDEVKIIKCADIIDNMHSIVTHDPDFAKVFLREVGDLLPLLETKSSSLWYDAVKLHEGFSSRIKASTAP